MKTRNRKRNSHEIGLTDKEFMIKFIRKQVKTKQNEQFECGGSSEKKPRIQLPRQKPSNVTSCQVCKREVNVHMLRRHMTIHTHKFICNICCIEFSSKSILERHMLRKHAERKFKCTKCGKLYGTKHDLKHHMRSHTPQQTCKYCSRMYDNQEKLRLHEKRTHEVRNSECALCSQTFTTYGELVRHRRRYHAVKLRCHYCSKQFGRNSLQKHIQIVHTEHERFQCGQCEKSYSANENLLAHVREIHGGMTFTCDACGKVYRRLSILISHRKRVHLGIRFTCEVCKDSFTTKAHLKYHITSKHVEANITYACDPCKKTFGHVRRLIAHNKLYHSERDTWQFACKICKKLFVSARNLKVHSQIHTRVRYQCKVCGKKCTQLGDLRYHERIHGGITFNCNVCHKKFVTKGILRAHLIEKHSPDTFTCQTCSKTYSSHPLLRMHMVTHGEKNFECTTCGKRFLRKIELRKHTNVHNPIKPQRKRQTHPCLECATDYILKADFVQHRRAVHKELLCDRCKMKFSCREHWYVHKSGYHKLKVLVPGIDALKYFKPEQDGCP